MGQKYVGIPYFFTVQTVLQNKSLKPYKLTRIWCAEVLTVRYLNWLGMEAQRGNNRFNIQVMHPDLEDSE